MSLISGLIGTLNSEKLVEEKKMSDFMIRCAMERKRSAEGAMNDWLDWNMRMFDTSNVDKEGPFSHYSEYQKQDPDYFTLTASWLQCVERYWEQDGRAYDAFGQMYEASFQSRGKASSTGQFFTPMSLARVMGQFMLQQKKEDEKILLVSDPTCGSGRLLLGLAEKTKRKKDAFYVAQDLDMQSVMMTALNLMAHGLRGMVICQDTLLLAKPKFFVLVNSTDYPLESGVYSLTRLSIEDAVGRGWMTEGDENGMNYTPIPDKYLSMIL